MLVVTVAFLSGATALFLNVENKKAIGASIHDQFYVLLVKSNLFYYLV